jgi:DNA transposition AAA+ family ATPase
MKTADAIKTYVETFTSRNILSTISLALQYNEPFLIIGETGIGKSLSINHFAATHDGVAIVSSMKGTGSVIRVLNEFIKSAGIWTRSSQGGGMIQELEGLLSDEYCLICDEAQHMDLDAMRIVLHLHEVTGLQVGFVGNPDVNNRKFVSRAAFAQIEDRIGKKLVIKKNHPKDVVDVAMGRNVTGAEAYDYLQRFGSNNSLRTVCKLLDEARHLAGEKGPITLSYLREAVQSRLGRDEERGLFKMVNVKPDKAERAA